MSICLGMKDGPDDSPLVQGSGPLVVMICGTRYFKNADRTAKIMEKEFDQLFADGHYLKAIHGGAVGVDHWANYLLTKKGGVSIEIFKPEYAKFGAAAPHIRNRRMADKADLILAFWDGKSKGTASVIKYAESRNKKYKIIPI
jgi:hypothetical protein